MNPIKSRSAAVTTLIELERVNPCSGKSPPNRIVAELRSHQLKMPNGDPITVYSINPTNAHTVEERNYIIRNFPFFHRRIKGSDNELTSPTGGDLLSPIPERRQDDRFDSYFSAAEVMATPNYSELGG
jgi:hypothetical protein